MRASGMDPVYSKERESISQELELGKEQGFSKEPESKGRGGGKQLEFTKEREQGKEQKLTKPEILRMPISREEAQGAKRIPS